MHFFLRLFGDILRALIIMGLAGKTEDRSRRLWQQCRYDLDVYGDGYGESGFLPTD